MRPIVILLVEDNYGDQRMVSEAIKESRLGTHLEMVGDGAEAMLYLRRAGRYANSPRPDVVLLDLNLPKKSGQEVLTEIRRETELKALPVVVFTGATATANMAALCALNPNFYILKPDRTEEFFAVIRAVEEYARNIVGFPESQQEQANRLRRLHAA